MFIFKTSVVTLMRLKAVKVTDDGRKARTFG